MLENVQAIYSSRVFRLLKFDYSPNKYREHCDMYSAMARYCLSVKKKTFFFVCKDNIFSIYFHNIYLRKNEHSLYCVEHRMLSYFPVKISVNDINSNDCNLLNTSGV